MISQVEGRLESVEKDKALVKPPGGLTLELLLPAFTAARLGGRVGEQVVLHTLAFFESQNQGATLLPRLAGFSSPEERQFFELFVTVKGIGHRRALRSMALATGQIAAAIADRDLAMLQSLPEIGRRTAETIAVTLKEKVDRFVSEAAFPARPEGPSQGPGPTDRGLAGAAGSRAAVAREAMEVLMQLGEKRVEAAAWLDQVLAQDNTPPDAAGLVGEVYRIKEGR